MRVDALSLLASGAAERAFANELFLRRAAKVARLDTDSRVLQISLGDGSIGLNLAQSFRCKVTAADERAELLGVVSKHGEAMGLGGRLETRLGPLDGLKPLAGSFAAVFATATLPLPFEQSAADLESLLAKDGRFCRIYPVRIGLAPLPEDCAAAWKGILGQALPSPAELLQSLERAGFEPELVESLSDAELEAVFHASPVPEEELGRHLFVNAKARVTYAAAMGRRKEPGEKPPASGDRG